MANEDANEITAREGQVLGLADLLAGASVLLEGVAALTGIGLIAAGLVLIFQTHINDAGHVTHPYQTPGIGLAVGGVVGGTFYWAVARTMHLFARFAEATTFALTEVIQLLYKSRTERTNVRSDPPSPTEQPRLPIDPEG